MKFILAKKIEMTQRFTDDGRVTPVTMVEAGPCFVVQVKSPDQDGYAAVQVGFGQRKKIGKSAAGHLKNLNNLKYLREFRILASDLKNYKRGDQLKIDLFKPGELVDIRGISKGKGFQGVVKRHHFAGSPATHGHKDQLRMPGSIGATDPARVFKGTRMPGRMGGEKVSARNGEIVAVEADKNILLIKGPVPGARHSVVEIRTTGKMTKKAVAVPETEVKKETKKPSQAAKKPAGGQKEKKDKK
jgi:large subunit ribosomal protein L3